MLVDPQLFGGQLVIQLKYKAAHLVYRTVDQSCTIITLHIRSDAHLNRGGVHRAIYWYRCNTGMVGNSPHPLLSWLKGYFSGIQLAYLDSKQSENIKEVCETTFPMLNLGISGKKLTVVKGLTVPGPAPPCSESHTTHMLLLPGPSTSTIVVAF